MNFKKWWHRITRQVEGTHQEPTGDKCPDCGSAVTPSTTYHSNPSAGVLEIAKTLNCRGCGYVARAWSEEALSQRNF